MITQGLTILVIYGGDSIYFKSLSGCSMEELSVLVAKLSPSNSIPLLPISFLKLEKLGYVF
jgi:hypothetical protein